MSLDLWDTSIWHAPSEQAYWDGQSVLTGASRVAATLDANLQRSTVQLVFDRTLPTLITDNVAVCTMSFVLPAGGGNSSILSNANKATIEGHLTTFWTTVKPWVSAHWTLKEYRWHDYVSSWIRPGPATRVTAIGAVATGSATNTVPDQVAMSITYKTSSRIHWGRTYLPGPTATFLTSTGRLATATLVDGIAGAARGLAVAATAAGTPQVVPSTSHRAVLAISSIQMDDTADVIRSRRAKLPSYRKTYIS